MEPETVRPDGREKVTKGIYIHRGCISSLAPSCYGSILFPVLRVVNCLLPRTPVAMTDGATWPEMESSGTRVVSLQQ